MLAASMCTQLRGVIGLWQNAAKSMQSQVGVLQRCEDGQIGILVEANQAGEE